MHAGLRPYMEDRHIVIASYQPHSGSGAPLSDGVVRSFAAVFDGHNGCNAAEHACNRCVPQVRVLVPRQ